jgi:transcriptional regulator GlxA family with amidase domain
VRARALLRTTELSIDDVAVEVGWSDATHFIRTSSREEGPHAERVPPRGDSAP